MDTDWLWSGEPGDLPELGRPGIPALLFTGDCTPRPATVGAVLSELPAPGTAQTHGERGVSWTMSGDPMRTPGELDTPPKVELRARNGKGGDRGGGVAVTPQLS